VKAVIAAVANAGIELGQVLGIGIGIPGIMDRARGLVRYSPYFGWRNVDFASAISATLGLPIFLENDVNTLTLAQQWFGHGRGIDHFAVVTVGRGIGSGYVLNGQFCHDAAGEIGHTTLMVGGPLCSCGKRGCLEALAADPAVVRDYQLIVGRTGLSLGDVVAAAESGDQHARHLLSHAGMYLGVGIANLINTLSPALIIISGEGLRGGEIRLDAMYQAIQDYVFAGLADQTRIVTEFIADQTWARGAACVVLNELFKSPLVGQPDLIDRLVEKAV
jgi:predicted NBD/HSP70 family sugar kinase